MVDGVEKGVKMKKDIWIGGMEYIKKLLVYGFIVMGDVVSKCFGCLVFEEGDEMGGMREIEMMGDLSESGVGE